MTKYQEFLNKINIISEKDFNEVINLFPEITISELDLYDIDLMDDVTAQQETIAEACFSTLLGYYDCVYVDELDFVNRTVYLEDVQSLEDLEEIKDEFGEWTIENYEDIKQELIEELEEKEKEKESKKISKLLLSIADKISIEEAEEIVRKYDKK